MLFALFPVQEDKSTANVVTTEKAIAEIKSAGDGLRVKGKIDFKEILIDGIKVKQLKEGTKEIAITGGPMDRVIKFKSGLEKRLEGTDYTVKIFDGSEIKTSTKKLWDKLIEKYSNNGERVSAESIVRCKMYSDNKKWATGLVENKNTVIDIGVLNSNLEDASVFYKMELNVIFDQKLRILK